MQYTLYAVFRSTLCLGNIFYWRSFAFDQKLNIQYKNDFKIISRF